jgi:hypothetical protein
LSVVRAVGWLAVAAWLWATAAIAQSAGGEVAERVVAVVNGRPITLSELEFEARVTLARGGATRALAAPLDEEALASALEYSIAQRLQAEEADRLESFVVPASEVETALRAFRERFDTEVAYQAFLRRHDMEEAQLGAVLERALRAERSLEARVRLRAQVSEAEIRRAYQALQSELRRPYEEVRAALGEKLQRDKYRQLVRAEIEQLRRGNDVRWLAPFPRPTAEVGR